MQRMQNRKDTPATASQTVTATESTAQRTHEDLPVILHLQAVSAPDERRVTWDEQVIDNENMGKKSSKGTSASINVSSDCYSMLYLSSTTRVWRVFFR